ncbi:PemB family protein [Elizabethkingia miricola]|uniref:hypothetical protein n=1 Tax=Elizabethkingia miricola TaxID=172045 RepID=UPI0038923D48
MAVNSELIETIKASQLPKISNPTTGDLLHAQGDNLSTTSMSEFLDKINTGVTGTITTSMTSDQLNALSDGIYECQTAGDYANGLTAKKSYITRFKKTGTAWTLALESQIPDKAFNMRQYEDILASEFPLPSGTQVTHEDSIFIVADGKTASELDVPGESDKWINLSDSGFENFNFKLASSETSGVPVDLQYMVSGKASPFSGFLKNIEFISAANGKAKFVILKRFTFNNSPEVAGGKDSFGPVGEFEIDVMTGRHSYDISLLNIFIRKGEYLGLSNPVGYVKPTIVNTSNYGWWQSDASALLTYQPNDVGFTYHVSFEKYEPNKFPVRTIVVSKNLANYNSIRNILDTITDASEKNRYVLFVPNGIYPECDLQGKAFVKIIGESQEGVIITCQGNSTSVSPSDYSYPAYANKPLNEIPREYLHTVFVKNDCYFENLTLDIERGKYTVHIDNPDFKNSVFNNVKFTEVDTNFTLGMGIWANQSIEFNDCIVQRSITTGQRLGFVIHNTTNQKASAKVKFKNTKFVSCGYGLVSELGSNQDDLIEMINCESDGVGALHLMVEESAPGSGRTMWVNPTTGTNTDNPTQVPYNLKVIAINTSIDIIRDRKGVFGSYPAERPDYIKHYSIDYVQKTGVYPPVPAGTVLSVALTNLGNYCMNANPFSNNQTDAYVLGVALNDSVDGIVYYAPTGKIAKTLVYGNVSPGAGQKLVFHPNGGLIEDTTIKGRLADAICYEDTVTDGKAYVKIN